MPLIKNISDFFFRSSQHLGAGLGQGIWGCRYLVNPPENLFVKVTCIVLVEMCLCIYVYLPLFSSTVICCQSSFDVRTKCGPYI